MVDGSDDGDDKSTAAVAYRGWMETLMTIALGR